MYNTDNDLESLKALVDFERSNLRNAQRERNKALAFDFATNLISFISRGKGARFSVSTGTAGKANSRLAEAHERLSQAQRDYNGTRALMAFKNIIKKGDTSNGDNRVVSSRFMSEGDFTGKNKFLYKPIVLEPGLQKQKKPRLLDLSSLNMNKKRKQTI